MAAIRDRDTKPEMLIRRGLHARGFRYHLQNRKLPGRPDLVFPKYGAVLFVNGCFWHGHDCPLFRWPATRTDYWREKIGGNVARDIRNEETLTSLGWRIGVVWECAVKGPQRHLPGHVIDSLCSWLESSEKHLSVHGQQVDRFFGETVQPDAGPRGDSLLRKTPVSER
jgi:DNA mismatch endonuclease (patch repair protein)